MRRLFVPLVLSFAAACAGGKGAPTAPTTPKAPAAPSPTLSADPPALNREFRGLWVATVANIDWPSRSTLSVGEQQAEMRAILDKAQSLRMNAVVLQIRSAGDALFRSSLEPWSRSLTGTQGADPGWDPLEAWVNEAHQRGLELHGWFNPYRAGNVSDTSRLAANHFARTRPDLARIAQNQLWFDPGETEVQDQTVRVILDVLARYDVDAVHLDDYFYPYPVAGAAIPVQFPDDASYAKYRAGGGADMPRADWRRQNVNNLIQRLYSEVHRVKPAVKVGLSPFGIWRPGNPAGVTGLDAYSDIFADSRTWLQNGWVDYFAPQLYWSLTSTGQNFAALLDWWIGVNTAKRHVWPGLAGYRVADGSSSAYTAQEIVAEITQTRTRAGAAAGGASGTLIYNTNSLRLNYGGLADLLAAQSFASTAVVPAFPWLDATPPAAPTVGVSVQGAAAHVTWVPGGTEAARWWLVQWRDGTSWKSRMLRGTERSLDLPFTGAVDRADVVAVTAFDAAWNASTPAVWR